MLRPSLSAVVQAFGSPFEAIGAHPCEIVLGGHRTGSGGGAAFDDLAQARAGPDLLGRQAVDLGVAAVAQDQPLVAIEKANALGDIVDRGLIAQSLRTQFSIRA